jgi:hypothetical protein
MLGIQPSLRRRRILVRKVRWSAPLQARMVASTVALLTSPFGVFESIVSLEGGVSGVDELAFAESIPRREFPAPLAARKT